MKKMIFLAAILLSGTAVFSQSKWTVDHAHSRISFSVRHMMMSDVEGNFRKFEATIVSSKEDFSDAVFEVKIDAASINTENDSRDKDLKSEKYFNVAKYPEITFKSTGLTKTSENNYKVNGNLTMHGVTKPVTLELTLNGTGTSPMTHKPVAGFKVSGKVSRTDFGIGDVPRAMIGDEITISANGEFGRE